MATAIDVVINFFNENHWKYDLEEESHRVRSGIEGQNGSWLFFISASDEQEMCFMVSMFPQKCPEKRRKACAELLTRINYGMLMGSFELNFETGGINFKTACPFVGGGLEAAVVKEVVGFNVSVMDKYLPAIMRVIYAGTSARQALAAVENEENARKCRTKPTKPELPRRFLNN
jgi:hypothetical protein